MATIPVTEKSVVFSASDNDEIAQVWKDTEAKVIEMAGEDRSKINKGLDIEDVLRYLDEVQNKNQKAAERYGTTKEIFRRTLQGISHVGGIVSDGASNVFGPASTCYNALTFVISAWQSYEGIFESLAALLENGGEFFDRLTEYAQSTMNKRLTKVACQYLKLFVEICNQSLRLKKKRNKFLALAKVFFLNEDGMKDLLASMKALEEREYGLVAAQTWRQTSEVATWTKKADLQLASLVSNLSEEKKDKEKQKWRKTVATALGLPSSIVDNDKTVDWEEAFTHHKNITLEGSGDWLAEEPNFTAWMNRDSSARPILGLEGEDGAGKTTLACNIITRLKRLKVVDGSSSTRSVVAYYFFEKDSKSKAFDQESASNASKTLLWQLAIADDPFMKSIVSICEERKEPFEKILDTWSELIFQNKDRSNMNSTFFVVIDGLDDNVKKLVPFLQRLSNSQVDNKLYILLTGPQSTFELLDSADIRINKITLGQPNQADIKIFVEDRMDNIDMLKDINRLGILDMRKKILESFMVMTKSDYYMIGRVLDDIKNTDDIEEIERLLENAGSMRPHQILADIEKLNQTRTAKEISEINEIILWINSGRSWLVPKEMEAALALRGGDGLVLTSLSSLEDKIRTKYSLFKVDEFKVIDYKVDEIKENIPLKRRYGREEGISDDITKIQPAEINLVKHYLSTVCPPEVYEKFGFQDFFDRKMVRQTSYIWQDPDNGHIKISLRCMNCLIEQRSDKTNIFLKYSVDNLLYHLNEADLSLADRDLKPEAGVLLVRLFKEDYAVTSLFWSNHSKQEETWTEINMESLYYTIQNDPYSWGDWIFCDTGLKVVSKYLKDSAVSEKIRTEPLVINYNSNEKESNLILFEVVIRKAAMILFRQESTKHDMLYSFLLLLAIFTRTNKKFEDDMDRSAILESLFKPNLQIVELVETFSLDALHIIEKDAIWEAQKAALLLYIHNENSQITGNDVEAQAQKALKLDPDSYNALYTMARVVKPQEKSIAILKDLIQTLTGNTDWRNKNGNNATLAAMKLELGSRYWESKTETQLAIQTYSEALQIDQSRTTLRSFIFILQRYDEQEQYKAVLNFIQDILAEQGDDAGKQIMGEFAIRLTYEYGFRLTRAVKAENRWDLVSALYGKALATATDYWEKLYILIQHGQICMAKQGCELDAIKIWESALHQPGDEDQRQWAIVSVSKFLVSAYIRLARLKASETDLVKEYYAKIETLYREFSSAQEQLSAQLSKDATIAFVRYFHLRGDDVRAKKVLKRHVLENLEMLFDDDIENDCTSYWDFMVIFSIMEDIFNARVAWEMMTQSRQASYAASLEKEVAEENSTAPKKIQEDTEGIADLSAAEQANMEGTNTPAGKEKENEIADARADRSGESQAQEIEKKEEGTAAEPEKPILLIASCDGDCGHDWQSASEMWVCADSGAIQFHEECYQKLMTGTLATSVCYNDHRFYHIGKRQEEKCNAVPKGYVLIDDKTVKLEDWKAEIRAKYVDFEEVIPVDK